jgi:5-methylcytosine-specific restriction enzyme subunit McrC
MYLTCLDDPVVAAYLGEPAVFIWHDQEPIECPEELKNDALIFLVLSYLQELNQLCLRHLRNQFIRTSENLMGRIKGRIDIANQVRSNLPRGRPDRTTCDFTLHSNNCRENKILKTALERSSRLLTKYGVPTQPVWSKVHFCRNELVGVEEIEVTPRLFQGIRYTGLFHPYKKAHALAKAIINAIPPDPHSTDSSKPTKIPPFAICTYELFERYCEVQLRRLKFSEQSDPRLWVGYQNMGLGEYKCKRLRPDFLLCSTSNSNHRWIIDAKNKPEWTTNVGKKDTLEWSSDVPQLCRYSLFTPILDELGYEKNGYSIAAPKMLVLYPSKSSSEVEKLNGDFFNSVSKKSCIADIQNLYAIGIDVPTR